MELLCQYHTVRSCAMLVCNEKLPIIWVDMSISAASLWQLVDCLVHLFDPGFIIPAVGRMHDSSLYEY